MPRSAAGTYTIPASGNRPVVSGTIANPTAQNNLENDVATELTDSLSRSNKGAMLAPLALYDGSVTAPGLAFANETGTGLYRIGASDVGFAIGGVKRAELTATGFSRASLVAVGQQTSTSCGTFTTASGTYVDVTNLTVTITTTGRPVVLLVVADGTNAGGLSTSGSATGAVITLQILRGVTSISQIQAGIIVNNVADFAPPGLMAFDAVVAGTYTYKVQAKSSGTGPPNVSVINCVLAAYEL